VEEEQEVDYIIPNILAVTLVVAVLVVCVQVFPQLEVEAVLNQL
jgi:hypothetical protein